MWEKPSVDIYLSKVVEVFKITRNAIALYMHSSLKYMHPLWLVLHGYIETRSSGKK
jgi:hypothetical protein